MRNKFKKGVSLALIGMMILGSLTPIFATVDETQTTDKNETLATDVYFNQDSSFTVTIPKLITLDSTKTSAYKVTVEGDIASNEQVNVVPEKEFLMKDQAVTGTKKADVTATVTQDKESWTFSEFATIGNGNVTAEGLTSGSWKGSFWFNISLDNLENESEIINLALSTDLLEMGLTNEIQVNATLNGENVNDIATWESDNENITANNGLVKTKASAQVGDEAIITVSVPQISTFSTEPTNEILAQATFKVVIVDMAFTTEGTNEIIDSIDIKPGESKTVEVTIIPNSATGTVLWSTTATSGLNLVKNGNSVTIEIAEDMPTGSSYDLVANYGDYSKLLKINIISDHVHSYTSSITTEPGCETPGVKTFTCKCNYTYTENVEPKGHSYSNGTCSNCGAADPDYIALEAGLYDANGVMLCSWEDSGINAEMDYSSSASSLPNNVKTCTTSPYYVITNKYPTTRIIVMPDNIEAVGTDLFSRCENLTKIVLPSELKSMSKNMFYGCSGLTSVGPIGSGASVEIPEKIQTIDTYVFYSCSNLENVTIPDTIQSINTSAFGYSNIKNLYISKSVTSMGINIFNDVATIESIIVDKDNPVYDSRDNSNSVVETNTNTLVLGCKNTIIADSVTTIGKNAFAYCGLNNITIPNNVQTIENHAFYKCPNLTNIIISNNCQSIGDSAFYNCKQIKNITIPSSVQTIGKNAFSFCGNLTSIIFEDTTTWYIGTSSGTTTTQINVSNYNTNATYLKDTYDDRYWTKTE